MKLSLRCLSSLLTGAAFVLFASLVPNCSPPDGSLPSGGNGGDTNPGGGDGGSSGNGGSSGSGGNSASSSGGSTTSNGGKEAGGAVGSGGSTTSNGGSSGTGTGGKSGGTGGKSGGAGGKTGSGGSSSSGGSSATSNGGSGAGGVQGSGGATTTPAAGGTTGTSTAVACSPAITSTGGLACPGGLCTVGTYAGYTYIYADKGGSKVCIAADSLCGNGSTAIADAKGTIWGAGIGFNLDKSTTPAAVQLAGTGMTYALSSLPSQGMRAQVSVSGTDYCAKLASASGTVKWTDFNTACWDNSGTSLTAAPSTPHIGFQVTAGTTAATFDFCVTKVTLE
jgi:hypothetical protein